MIVLDDVELGRLELSCTLGYVVTSFQIGAPEVRAVERNRALADGGIDDTQFVGCRAITVALRLDSRVAAPQVLLDALLPYLSPRRRPELMYSLRGSEEVSRAYMVRGADWPLEADGSRFPTQVLQWKTCEPYALAPEASCVTFIVSQATEAGRPYDLTFPRDYPAGAPSGSFYAVNAGNAPADWTATIVGPITDPTLSINGVTIAFTGVTVLAGQTLIIDTKERTMWLNGDPSSSRYGNSNFQSWGWDDVRLRPGTNMARLTGTSTTGATAVTMCWRSAWL